MLQTVEVILEPSGHVRLLEPLPVSIPCRAILTVLEAPSFTEPNPSNGQALARLLEQMASEGIAEVFGDPIAWQREQRQDCPLPGRD